jgi:hypothetical protein
MQYGAERLAANPAAQQDARDRHCRFFAQLAGRSFDAFKGNQQAEWVHQVTAEIDNLRVALGRAAEDGNAEAALRISGGVGWYWFMARAVSEGLSWFDIAFSSADAGSPGARSYAMGWREMLSSGIRVQNQGKDADLIVALAEETGDPDLAAFVKLLVAEAALGRGDVALVREMWDSAQDYYAAQEDLWSAVVMFAIGASRALVEGDKAEAERLFAASAPVCSRQGTLFHLTIHLEQASTLAESRGDYVLAASCLEQAMRAAIDLGFGGHQITRLARLANLADLAGDAQRARALYDEASEAAYEAASPSLLADALSGIALRHRRADRLDQAEATALRALSVYREGRIGAAPYCARVHSAGAVGSLCTLGFIAETRGQATEADGYHREAVAEARMIADPRALALCLEGLAGVALLASEHERAAALLGASDRLRNKSGLSSDALAELVGTIRGANTPVFDDRFDADRITNVLRERLGPEAFEAAWAAGAGADLEDLAGGATGL